MSFFLRVRTSSSSGANSNSEGLMFFASTMGSEQMASRKALALWPTGRRRKSQLRTTLTGMTSASSWWHSSHSRPPLYEQNLAGPNMEPMAREQSAHS